MLIKLDAKGRATIPKALTAGHGLFQAEVNEFGHIELTPVEVKTEIIRKEHADR